MGKYQFVHEQWLPIGVDVAWEFFSDPANLAVVSPPAMQVELVEGGGPVVEGQVVRHRFRIAPGVRVIWVSRIEEVEAPLRFVDRQLRGPFKAWRHCHELHPEGDGVRVVDPIDYELLGGPLAGLANALVVRRQLAAGFRFRFRVLAERFGAGAAVRVAPPATQ